jgi:hypothetical protein
MVLFLPGVIFNFSKGDQTTPPLHQLKTLEKKNINSIVIYCADEMKYTRKKSNNRINKFPNEMQSSIIINVSRREIIILYLKLF